MPILTIKTPGRDRHIVFSAGRSIRDILDETDIRVRAGCNGGGACGMCRIRVAGGHAGEPSPNEVLTLDPGMLSSGIRLACQVKADSDLQIEIINPAPRSCWRRLDEGRTGGFGPQAISVSGSTAEGPLGAAIDLGTTHISITVLDLVTGRRLAGRRGLNPQASSGTDVLTRLQAAESAGQAFQLSRMVIDAIADGLHDICAREGIDLRRITRAVLVGNTAMLALLSERNYHLLLQPLYWSRPIECSPAQTAAWADTWQIGRGAAIEVVPPVAGFVGSDLLSGVVATKLIEHGPGELLLDFGTNSEAALWDGRTLWVTSAAGGPAFEGCGMGCGMPADPGAVYRVHSLDPPGGPAFDVIGGVEPLALCGSGMVDLLACLIRNGLLNSKGQFAPVVPASGFPFEAPGRTITISKKDIDTFQRAKAAIGVAVEVLLEKAGMGYNDLRRIGIGGVFGQYLNPDNAKEIGLLPSVSGLMVETLGNSALSGCETMLLSEEGRELPDGVTKLSRIINLSACPDFDSLFMEHLYLKRVGTGRE